MLILLYVTIYLFLSIITWIKYGTLVKPNQLFNTMWCFGAIIASTDFVGLYPTSEITQIYILLSILSFNIFYILFAKKWPKFDINFNFSSEIRYNLIYISNFLSYIFLAPILINAIKIINTSGWDTLRGYAFVGSDLLASTLQIRITAWIIYPIFLSTILLAVIFAIKRIKKYPVYFMAAINLVVYTVSFGGRYDIVKTLGYFVFSFFVLNSVSKIKMKVPKKYVFLGIGIFLVTVYLTTLRSLNGLNFIENTIVYFFGSLTFFDIIIHSSEFSVIHENSLYGTGVLGFLLNPLLYLGTLILNIPNYTSEYSVKLVTDNYLYISDNVRYNAMASALYPFWRDGGGIGIVVGMSIFSLLVVITEKLFFKYKSIRFFSLYIFMLFIVFTSVMTYDLLTIRTFMNIIFIIVFTKYSLKVKKNNSRWGIK